MRKIIRQRNRWGGGAALPPVEPVAGQQPLNVDSHEVVVDALVQQQPDPEVEAQTTEAGPDVPEGGVQTR